ncbi:PRC and DUF2382 domain-containing protein [Herbiconiux daphne]|uniref:PRC and DUF2382 domain-containing protein n=1 Tax=Herbiconiux daphne TaxID=2970914 RepID=A0ABT2GWV1_9MICO|nr:PRC and DUF2382 domain-containing protein [Herbiconiux daphne]MCS5732441.1 PRC and DUF2382 domain-containing protein [Herbiconiux daphne]
MIDSSRLDALTGATVYDNDGDKIGSVGQVFLDPATGGAAWITVKTGLFGTGESFVPATEANWDGDDVRVPYEKDFVKDAPRVDTDGELDQNDTDNLYTYYGYNAGSADYDSPTDTTVGHDTSGPNTDDAITRSEEHLRVGTERVETGRARLHKYVVTEQETVTVPVSHEEVRVVTEPITDGNIGDALDGPAISEEEHEVVLTGDRVITDTEAVPVERVRLDTETVTEQETVTGDVRKERIDIDGDTTSGTTNTDGTAPRI